MLEQLLLFTDCSNIQFFNSPPPLITQRQSVRPPLVASTTVCSPCVTYGTLCHAISHQVLPNRPLTREAEISPRSDKCFNHVPLLT